MPPDQAIQLDSDMGATAACLGLEQGTSAFSSSNFSYNAGTFASIVTSLSKDIVANRIK